MMSFLRKTPQHEVNEIRNDLARFVLHMNHSWVMPKYQQIICYELTLFAKYQNSSRLALNVPAQHSKSTLSILYNVPWIIGNMGPVGIKIGIVTHAQDLASLHLRSIFEIMSSEEYRQIFPHVKLPEAKSLKKTTEHILEFEHSNGSIKAIGITGKLSGFSLDLCLIDDAFNSIADCASEAIQNKVWSNYVSVLEKRLMDNGRILLLGTVFGSDDLFGKVFERDGRQGKDPNGVWRHVSFPALYDPTHPSLHPLDDRKPDDALWEGVQSAKKYIKNRKDNYLLFQLIDQQLPVPTTGLIINPEQFDVISLAEYGKMTAMFYPKMEFFCDTAQYGKDSSDYSAIMACFKHNDSLYIRMVAHVKLDFTEQKKWIHEFQQEYGSRFCVVHVEPKSTGASIVDSMKKDMKDKIPIKEFKFGRIKHVSLARLDKVARVTAAVITPLEAGKIILVEGNWNESFKRECAAFPSRVDDRVDCLTMASYNAFYKKVQKGIRIA